MLKSKVDVSKVISKSKFFLQSLTSEEQLSAGVTPGYIRLSIGIENIEDILSDVEQAINKAS